MNRCNMIGKLDRPGWHDICNRVYGTDALSPSITTKCGGGQEPYIMVMICNAE